MKIKPTEKPGHVLVELDRNDDRLLSESAEGRALKSPFQLKKILVPIDFSECSRKALQYALPFAKQFGASLVLVNAVYTNYAYGEYAGMDFAALEQQLCASSEKQLASLAAQEVAAAVPFETRVSTGRASNEIIEAAKELDVDLIVLSTHGRTGLKHVFMGSTAEEVVRRAPCPVLTVREQEHEFITV